MMDLRANTAVDVLIGPFVNKDDGNTTEDGLAPIAQAAIKLSKNGQALTQKTDATGATFDDDGYYNCELDATDTNTEGNLVLIVHISATALPVRHEFNVLSKAAWDSLYANKDTGFMDVNVKAVSEDTTAADNLELACDNYSATRGLSGTALPAVASDGVNGLVTGDGSVVFTAGIGNRPAVDVEGLGGTVQSATDLKDFADAGYDPGTNKVQGVVLVDGLAADSVDSTSIADNAITAAKIAASAIGATQIGNNAITAGKIASNAITSAKIAAAAIGASQIGNNAITAGKIADGAIDNAAFAADVGSTAYATNIMALAADKALVEQKLDHLVAQADADTPVNDSIIGKLASTDGDWSNFSETTDSLQSIRDKQTDIEADTGEIGTAGVGLTDLGGMSDAMKAEILSEVNDALDTVIVELGIAAPAAEPTMRTGLMLLYMALRNKLIVQTSGTDALEIHRDDGTKICAGTITDAAGDMTRAELA